MRFAQALLYGLFDIIGPEHGPWADNANDNSNDCWTFASSREPVIVTIYIAMLNRVIVLLFGWFKQLLGILMFFELSNLSKQIFILESNTDNLN